MHFKLIIALIEDAYTDDVMDAARKAGADVAARGFKGLKTNIMMFDAEKPYIHMPGFNGPSWPELNYDHRVRDALVAEMGAFRRGAGPGVGLHLDLNFNFKTEGYIRMAQALEQFDLTWLEIDSYDPDALATIRRDRKSTRLNSSHMSESRMPSSA